MLITAEIDPQTYSTSKIFADGQTEIARVAELVNEPSLEMLFILNYLGSAWEIETVSLGEYDAIMEVFQSNFHDIVEPQIERILSKQK